MRKTIIAAVLFITTFCMFNGNIYCQSNSEKCSEKMLAMGIKFFPPEEWKEINVATSTQDGIAIFFTDPHGKAIINVVWNKRFGSNEASFNSALEEYRNFIKNFTQLLSEEKGFVSRTPCYIFTLKVVTQEETKQIKDYIISKNGKTYNLTYTASVEEFNNYLPIFEEMVSSFGILK